MGGIGIPIYSPLHSKSVWVQREDIPPLYPNQTPCKEIDLCLFRWISLPQCTVFHVLKSTSRKRGDGDRRGAGTGWGVGRPCRVPREPEDSDRLQQLEDRLTTLIGLVQ